MVLRRSFAIVSAIHLLAAIVCPAAETDSRGPAKGAPETDRTANAREPVSPPTAEKPVFSFAWISDLHLGGSRLELARTAFRWIDRKLAPDFVLFTGDDNAIPAPAEDPTKPQPEDSRRHQFFKDFLAGHLRAPAVVIPGDNWPGGFDQVFGAAQRSFDCCGLHFLLLAPDRTHKVRGMEGLSALDETTCAWIRKDLDASRDKPVIVAIHEPIHPPTFLDAMVLRRLVARHPQVIAVLQGHLHMDLQLQAGGTAYLSASALGPTSVHSLKQVLVFPDRLVIRTFACDPKTAEFAPLGPDWRVEVPRALRANLRRPDGGFKLEKLAEVPPHPHIDDPALTERKWELLRNLSGLLDPDVLSPARRPPSGTALPPD